MYDFFKCNCINLVLFVQLWLQHDGLQSYICDLLCIQLCINSILQKNKLDVWHISSSQYFSSLVSLMLPGEMASGLLLYYIPAEMTHPVLCVRFIPHVTRCCFCVQATNFNAVWYFPAAQSVRSDGFCLSGLADISANILKAVIYSLQTPSSPPPSYSSFCLKGC